MKKNGFTIVELLSVIVILGLLIIMLFFDLTLINSVNKTNELTDKYASVVESMGGKVSGSVSSKTSFLINNDTQSSSSKNQKAKQLNIPIISEQDFINMIS